MKKGGKKKAFNVAQKGMKGDSMRKGTMIGKGGVRKKG